jgi:hypothetical protein
MSKVQSSAVNNWAYFQAKSTKQNLAENTIDILTIQKLNAVNSTNVAEIQNKIQKFQDKVTKYEKEKNEIKAAAEKDEKSYNDMNVFDDQFDMTEAFLSISIALYGLTALTQNKRLFYFALGLSTAGFIYGMTAFLGISLHSDFIANILG